MRIWLLAVAMLLSGCVGNSSDTVNDAPIVAEDAHEHPHEAMAVALPDCTIHLGYMPFPTSQAPLPQGWSHVPFQGTTQGTFLAAAYACAGPNGTTELESMGALLVEPPTDLRDKEAAAHLVLQNGLSRNEMTRPAWKLHNISEMVWADSLEFESQPGNGLHMGGTYAGTEVHLVVQPVGTPASEPATKMRFFALDADGVRHSFALEIPHRAQITGGVSSLIVQFPDGTAVALPPGLGGFANNLDGDLVWRFGDMHSTHQMESEAAFS